MGNIAAAYYGLPNVRFYSGGTAPSAFNSRTIAALGEIDRARETLDAALAANPDNAEALEARIREKAAKLESVSCSVAAMTVAPDGIAQAATSKRRYAYWRSLALLPTPLNLLATSSRAEVPKLAVEYVMYHEMLHLRHPVEHQGTRRCVHTAAFKAEEKKFPLLKEAKKLLKTLV